MRLYYTICEDGDGYPQIEKISLVPIKNCYYTILKDDKIFDFQSQDKLTPYNNSFTVNIVIMENDIEFDYDCIITYKEGVIASRFSINDLYDNIKDFLDKCVIKDLNLYNIIDDLKTQLKENNIPIRKKFFDKYINL